MAAVGAKATKTLELASVPAVGVSVKELVKGPVEELLNPKPVGAVSSTLFCKLSPATVSVWALEFTPVQVLLKALAEVLESAGH
jgi:hypothetical protein